MTKSVNPTRRPSKSTYLRFEIATRFGTAEKAMAEQLYEKGEVYGCTTIDQLVDFMISSRKASWRSKPRKTLPKWLRPQCGAKTRAGSRCRATPVWDKKSDRPKNGRCRMHGGLSTGPKTEKGKQKALKNLKNVCSDK